MPFVMHTIVGRCFLSFWCRSPLQASAGAGLLMVEAISPSVHRLWSNRQRATAAHDQPQATSAAHSHFCISTGMRCGAGKIANRPSPADPPTQLQQDRWWISVVAISEQVAGLSRQPC